MLPSIAQLSISPLLSTTRSVCAKKHLRWVYVECCYVEKTHTFETDLSIVTVVKSCSGQLILLLVQVCIEEVEMDSTFCKSEKNSMCVILR